MLSTVGWAEAHRGRSEGLSRRRGFWDGGGGGLRAKTSLEILQLVQVKTTRNKSRRLLRGKFEGIFLEIASATRDVPILSFLANLSLSSLAS